MSFIFAYAAGESCIVAGTEGGGEGRMKTSVENVFRKNVLPAREIL